MASEQRTLPGCPICGKPTQRDYKPFCSKRCADLDLRRWLNGAYVIAGETEAETGAPSADLDGSHEDF